MRAGLFQSEKGLFKRKCISRITRISRIVRPTEVAGSTGE
jgi:hypothetical protein